MAGDALTSSERLRLARFADAFERMSANEYAMFASRSDDAETRDALAAADAALGNGVRRRAVTEAAREFSQWAHQAYARRLNLADTFLLYQVLPDHPVDRVRALASLERAVVAVILWDTLDNEHLGALVGPWADTVARAGIE